MLQSVMESKRLFVSEARGVLAADASAVKLGRFPKFIQAIVAKLQAQARTSAAPLCGEQSTADLVREAANEVTDWREACAAERVAILEQMELVEPVKAKTLELLGVQSG